MQMIFCGFGIVGLKRRSSNEKSAFEAFARSAASRNASRSSKDPSARSKSRRSFLQYSDAQERRWKKVFKLHSEKWEPPKSKALKSGCHDFAQCL